MSRTEFDRIARLARHFGIPRPPDVGIGDDCAVLHPASPVLVSVDAAVEGVHFRRDLASLEDVSLRATEAAVSDIAAMGGDLVGSGSGILLAWALPPNTDDDALDALARGARLCADRVGATIVGGNLTSSPVLILTTTVIGRAAPRTLTRGGARPGDVVAASGPMGAAALGLRALLAHRGDEALFAECVARWRRPRARIDLGRPLAPVAHAAIDVSDGLAQDAGHIALASGCRLVLHADAIPMVPSQRACAEALETDALELALTGGEDYELLACGPRSAFAAPWVVIGEVVSGSGVWLDNRPLAGVAGWDHFEPVSAR